jgi:peptide/nickel transport system substrate-binding protein
MPVFRRIVLLALAGSLQLLGMAPHAGPAQAQTESIIIGVTDLPNTLDPGEAYGFMAWEVLSHLYTGLTRQIPGTLDYELVLAETYTVSTDRLVYTFTLRDDSTFSDGTPITAQTFVDSVNRVLALKQDAEQVVQPYVESVEASNAGELIFCLKRPVPDFLALLALPPYFPVHPTLSQADRPQPFPETLIGNGPYTLDQFDVREQIVLKANPAYDLGPQPLTPTIILKRFARSQDLRDALQAHDIDLAWRALFLGHLFQLEAVEGLNVVEVPSTRVFYFYMGQAREPTDDPLVREALTLLLNRQEPIDAVFQGHVSPLTSLVPSLFPDAYAPIWPDTPDVEQAEAVLRTAAYSERVSSRLNLSTSFSQPVYGDVYASAVIQFDRASFGATQFIQSSVFADIEATTFVGIIERGEGSTAVFGWTPVVPHPDAYLRPLAHSGEPIATNGRYASQQVDFLLDEAARLDDPMEQGELYQEVAQWLLDTHAIAPIWQDHLQVVAWDDIDGILIEPNFFLHYDQLVRR